MKFPPLAAFFVLLSMALALAPPGAARGASRSRTQATAGPDAHAADTLIVRGLLRGRELERWAGNAGLADLVWILRRPAGELGAAEGPLVAAALSRTPAERAALRSRLESRLALAEPGRKAGGRGAAPARAAANVPRPRASVFHLTAVLPGSGDYADYARDLVTGLQLGLASIPAPGGRTVDLEVRSTGDADPARIALALERPDDPSGLLVGELLSVNTFALATAARLLGLPLISPTATDEAIGAVGPSVFQIGPSGWRRGERLARVMVSRPGMRVGTLTTTPIERDPLSLGFAATAESLGATAEWRADYAPGGAMREEVRQIATRKLEVLMWDGESRDAEVLLKELSRQKVSVQVCGSEALAPERLHAETRLLLDGVRYVADEWKLPDPERAGLDSALAARDLGRASPLHARGWLTGRAVALALADGALCPEELAVGLTARCGAAAWLAAHRFLDAGREGATLPVFQIQRGRAAALEP